jgi:allantoicase
MSTPDFTDLIDLAAERLGGAVLWANDEFFAPKESLLRAAAAEWREHRVHRSRQVDGWLGDASSSHAG